MQTQEMQISNTQATHCRQTQPTTTARHTSRANPTVLCCPKQEGLKLPAKQDESCRGARAAGPTLETAHRAQIANKVRPIMEGTPRVQPTTPAPPLTSGPQAQQAQSPPARNKTARSHPPGQKQQEPKTRAAQPTLDATEEH